MKKKWLVIGGIILVILIICFIFNKSPTGQSVQQIEITPLSVGEKSIIQQALVSNEFVNDVPKDEPISIRFFSFQNGQRIWHDAFLIGENKEPTIYIILHSKYIPDLDSQDLCSVIKRANKNGDLGFYSEHNKASLFIKYAGMLKYRGCFGI